MHVVPHAYKSWRSALDFDEISFGAGGVRLEQLDQIDQAQIGYSVSPQGESFCTGQSGDWQENWLVIGNDTALGDPLIIDTAAANLPVLTAMHGTGNWDPTCIAVSLSAFGAALAEVHRLSIGRESPVALDKHPLPARQRRQALAKIKAANPGADMQFWESLLCVEESKARK